MIFVAYVSVTQKESNLEIWWSEYIEHHLT